MVADAYRPLVPATNGVAEQEYRRLADHVDGSPHLRLAFHAAGKDPAMGLNTGMLSWRSRATS
jgi:hypothetical protein